MLIKFGKANEKLFVDLEWVIVITIINSKIGFFYFQGYTIEQTNNINITNLRSQLCAATFKKNAELRNCALVPLEKDTTQKK